MQTLNIHEAKNQLSRLVEAVASGEEIVIARAGVPSARLAPIERKARRFGGLKGKIRIADDFDYPLPEDVVAAWAGAFEPSPSGGSERSGSTPQ